MHNIYLVCEHGASTSMLMERMADAAKEEGIEVDVRALPYTKLGEVIDGADVVLLGPQVRFKKSGLEQQFADKGVDFVVIDTVDYGMMRGDKVLKVALEHIKN